MISASARCARVFTPDHQLCLWLTAIIARLLAHATEFMATDKKLGVGRYAEMVVSHDDMALRVHKAERIRMTRPEE